MNRKLGQGLKWLALFMIVPLSMLALASWGQAAPAPAGVTSLDCETNPFSTSYDLFGEGEIFVGFQEQGGPDNVLAAFALERRLNNGEVWLLEEQLFTETGAAWGAQIAEQVAVAADLDGDGYTEMVQSFVTANNTAPGYYLAVYDHLNTRSTTFLSSAGHHHLAAAAGNLLGGEGEGEQLVLASVNPDTGALTLVLRDGSQQLGVWRNSDRYGQATAVDVAVGNLTNDRQDDIVVSVYRDGGEIDLLLLTYDPAHSSGSGSNLADGLKLLAADGFSPGQMRDVQVTLARLDGDFQDEIVVAADSDDEDSPGYSPEIRLWVYGYDPALEMVSRSDELYATIPSNSTNFSLAAGDVDKMEQMGASPEEIVIGFGAGGSYPYGAGFAVEVWRAEGVDTPAPALARVEQWVTNNTERDRADYLSLQVADLDNDGRKEIVAALDDGRGLEVLYLTYADLVADAADLPNRQQIDLDPTALGGRTALAVGDRDNDALKAVAGADCRRITEQEIVAVGFAPPYWAQIQGSVTKGAWLGRTEASDTLTTTSLSYYRSDTVSGFAGGQVSVGFDMVEVEASARVTAAETKSRGSTQGGTSATGESLEVYDYGNDHFLIYGESLYNCYAYTLFQNGVSIPDSGLRNCDFAGSSRSSTDLDVWDNTFGANPGGQNRALTWTPVIRDWATLGLFRGAYAAQSSTAGGQGADRAVDGILQSSPANNSVATTAVEDNPWWQLDLGEAQPLSKVRIWNRSDWLQCADFGNCPNQLTHIYVLISEQDFRTMPEEGDPAGLMARSDVHAFSLADYGTLLNGISADTPLGKVTTFLTLENGEPVQGRFVRVQRVQPGALLSLGEVQVFGANHVDPHRYPIQVRDTVPHDDVFEVQLYNGEGSDAATTWPWVEVRGNLLWNNTGYDDGVLNGQKIGVGGSGLSWEYGSWRQSGDFSTSSLSHETQVGAEFEYSSGAVFKLQAGYGQEYTTGTTSEFTTERSWTEAIGFGGKVENLPGEYGGPVWSEWASRCAYQMRPYQYELVETSTFGQESRYTVLDYVVPDTAIFDDSAGLNRANHTAMAACHNGNQTAGTPQAAHDQVAARAGGQFTFHLLANDAGNNLQIVGVSQPQQGTVAFSGRTLTYTPASGFTGTDTFTYTISDGTSSSEGTVSVEVAPVLLYLPTLQR